MSVGDPFAAFDDLRREFRRNTNKVQLLLVDLANSTAYKAQNAEINWITRLKKFYDVVTSAAASVGTCKYLGDGILITSSAELINTRSFYKLAQRILSGVTNLNRDFSGDHKLNIRIILNSGEIYPFGDDPQGMAVDKLFRMEKFVPVNCIGMTEEFAQDLDIQSPPIARFPLKGLPNPATHGLFLSEETVTPAIRKKLRNDSYLAELWAQPGSEEPSQIILVGGHIPGGAISTVQMGDVNAKLQTLHILATLGYAKEIEVCDSSNILPTAYQKNIIAIGGPCFNSVTRNLLAGLPVEFENLDGDNEDIDDTPLVIRKTDPPTSLNVVYEDARLSADWGLFVKMQNPSNTDRKIMIACGIESPGVEGIVKAFTQENPNFSQLMDKVITLGPSADGSPIPDFFCVMRIPVELGHRAVLPPGGEQVKYIYRL
jgi:hypothetical protein